MDKNKQKLIMAGVAAFAVVMFVMFLALAVFKSDSKKDSWESKSVRKINHDVDYGDIISAQEFEALEDSEKFQYENRIFLKANDNLDIYGCDHMIGEERIDLCLKIISIEARMGEWCGKIKNGDRREECHDKIKYYNALDGKDWNGCGEIRDGSLQDACFTSILVEENYSERECRKFEGRQKDLCFSRIFFEKAIEDADGVICSEIPLADDREECIGMFKN